MKDPGSEILMSWNILDIFTQFLLSLGDSNKVEIFFRLAFHVPGLA